MKLDPQRSKTLKPPMPSLTTQKLCELPVETSDAQVGDEYLAQADWGKFEVTLASTLPTWLTSPFSDNDIGALTDARTRALTKAIDGFCATLRKLNNQTLNFSWKLKKRVHVPASAIMKVDTFRSKLGVLMSVAN